MNTFMFALNAIMPIILLILLGYILKKKGFLDEGWFFSNLAKINSPLALIILGGLFDFAAVKELKKQIFIGTVVRVVVVPCLVLGVAIILSKYVNIINIDNTAFPALIALSGSPVAVSSAIMAQEMENDGVLAGQLVVWTSVMSIFTLFIIIAILRGLGVL